MPFWRIEPSKMSHRPLTVNIEIPRQVRVLCCVNVKQTNHTNDFYDQYSALDITLHFLNLLGCFGLGLLMNVIGYNDFYSSFCL